MMSTGDGVKGIEFVETLRSLPRKPSFWLDDWLFWFPILKDACGQTEPPSDTNILVTDKNAFNPIHYDEATKQVSVPIAVACELFNQYVMEMGFEPDAAIASDFTIVNLYTLHNLYHSMGTDKEPWILKILFKSAIDFQFNSLVEFVKFRLDRRQQSAGAFLDDLLKFSMSNKKVSSNKKRVLNATITEEPLSSTVRDVVGPVRDQSSMDVLIVTPLAVEWAAVVRKISDFIDLPNEVLPLKAGYIGKFKVACLRCGKYESPACARTTQAIERYKPRIVIISGVAGVRPKRGIHQGDVIVASHIYGVGGKIASGKFTPRPELDWDPDPNLVHHAENFAETSGEWRRDIGQTRPDRKDNASVRVHSGYVLSLDTTVDDLSYPLLKDILDHYQEVDVFEMESSGVGAAIKNAQASYRVLGLTVRCISDVIPSSPNSKRKDGQSQRRVWKPYASDVAATFVRSFLSQLPIDAYQSSGDPVTYQEVGTPLETQISKVGFEKTLETWQATLQERASLIWEPGTGLLWEDSTWSNAKPNTYPVHPDNKDSLFAILAALRRGESVDVLLRKTGMSIEVLQLLKSRIDMEKRLLSESLTPELLLEAKNMGFSFGEIGVLADRLPEQVRYLCRDWKLPIDWNLKQDVPDLSLLFPSH